MTSQTKHYIEVVTSRPSAAIARVAGRLYPLRSMIRRRGR
jgi:hypothetical protein